MEICCKIDIDGIVEDSMIMMGGNNDDDNHYYSMSMLLSCLVLIRSA